MDQTEYTGEAENHTQWTSEEDTEG